MLYFLISALDDQIVGEFVSKNQKQIFLKYPFGLYPKDDGSIDYHRIGYNFINALNPDNVIGFPMDFIKFFGELTMDYLQDDYYEMKEKFITPEEKPEKKEDRPKVITGRFTKK